MLWLFSLSRPMFETTLNAAHPFPLHPSLVTLLDVLGFEHATSNSELQCLDSKGCTMTEEYVHYPGKLHRFLMTQTSYKYFPIRNSSLCNDRLSDL